MNGGWASALGAAILGGNQSYQGALLRKRQEQQQKFENDRLTANDAQNAKLQALQLAITQSNLDELPKQRAMAKAQAMLELDGPEAAYDNPAFLEARQTAGLPAQTRAPLFGPVQGKFADDYAAANEGMANAEGFAPHTGAVLPQSVVAGRQALQQKQNAQHALLGSNDPRVQGGAVWQMATGQAPPSGMFDTKWTTQKMQDGMGNDYLVQVSDDGQVRQLGGGPGGGGGNAAPAANGLSGDEFLKTLDPKTANAVKLLAEYRGVLPSGMALSKPYWQDILQKTQQYEPTFDAQMYGQRAAVRRDFAVGAAAKNLRSANTAVKHLDTLRQKAEALGNMSVPLFNRMKNSFNSGVGDPRVVGFNEAATAVQNELASLFKGTGATDQEIKEWRAHLDAAGSPQQQAEALKTAVELLDGRVQQLQYQWEQGMGTPKGFQALQPDSQAVLERLRSGGRPQAQPAAPPPAAGKPSGIRILSVTPVQ